MSCMTAAQDKGYRFASNTLKILLTPDLVNAVAVSGVTIWFSGPALIVDAKPRALSAAHQDATPGFGKTLEEILPNAAMIAADSTSVALAAIVPATDDLRVLDAAEKARLLLPKTRLVLEIQLDASEFYFNSAVVSTDLEVALTFAIEPAIALLDDCAIN